MPGDGSSQRAAEIAGWIGGKARRRDRVAKDPARELQNTLRGLVVALCFDTSKGSQEFRSGELRNRQRANGGSKPANIVNALLRGRLGHPLAATLVDELPGDNSESANCVGGRFEFGELFSRAGSLPSPTCSRAMSRRSRAAARLIAG